MPASAATPPALITGRRGISSAYSPYATMNNPSATLRPCGSERMSTKVPIGTPRSPATMNDETRLTSIEARTCQINPT